MSLQQAAAELVEAGDGVEHPVAESSGQQVGEQENIGVATAHASFLQECLPRDLTTTANADEPVCWPKDVSPVDFRDYRVGTDRESKRAIDEIPPEELANAMYEVLVDFASCERDVLFRETIRLFGLNTLTAKARQYLEYAVAVLRNTGRLN